MVKSKYEETEIGVLPEDWEVIDFEDCLEFLPNNTLSRSELNYDFGEVRNIHYGDILIDIPSILDCSKYELPFINMDNSIKNPRSFLRDGDLIVADTAEDETVGKATEIYNIETRKVVSGLHTIACRPKTKFEPKWLGYFINHRMYHDQLLPYITGTKVSAISKGSIKLTKVVRPLPEEQTAIVEAVDDINQLINSLERLIRKKKAIKKGAMQELLTGSKRLIKSTKQWEKVLLGDIVAHIRKGDTLNSSNYELGTVPVIAGGKEAAGYHSKSNRGKNTITISASGANAGYIGFHKQAIFATDCSTIEEDKNYNVRFIYYLLLLKQELVYKLQTGGAQPHVYPRDLEEIEFYYTESLEEQDAIVQILSDMDMGIEQLQEKLNKYQKIKHGMLDELLTGKIRLI